MFGKQLWTADFVYLIQRIVKATFLFAVYKLGLYDDADTEVIKQRKLSCQDCPLRSGNWCSKKKFVEFKVQQPKGRLYFRDRYQRVRGCGCFLFLKYHDRKEPQSEICPRKIWKHFKK